MVELVYYETRIKETPTTFELVPDWFYLKIEDDGRASTKIDLTKVFGEGNEPHSVEMFKRIFPTQYQNYTED